MKLAELLLQRAQLQSDLAEQTRTVSDNAQVLEGEEPLEDVEVVLEEYWKTNDRLEQMQRQIQDINVKSSYDPSMTMSHALIRRELLRKQIQTMTSVLQSATANVRYSTKDIRRIAVIDVPALKEKLSQIKKQSQQMDVNMQKRNWDIDVP